MERRTQLGLLILFALAILAFGVWYLLQPVFKTVRQPPALTGQQFPTTIPTSTGGVPVISGSAEAVAPDVKKLLDLAGIVVARMGSGASGEGFQGYDDVMINATLAYRVTLKAEQQAMRAAHPAAGPEYGVLTRVIATDPISALPGAAQMTYRVQVQQVEDIGNAPSVVTYKEAIVTFDRQSDGTYLVSGVVWKDIEL
jgi:hypothetical protein